MRRLQLYLILLGIWSADASQKESISKSFLGKAPRNSSIRFELERHIDVESKIASARNGYLNAVVAVSSINVVMNTLRPDDAISWQVRQ